MRDSPVRSQLSKHRGLPPLAPTSARCLLDSPLPRAAPWPLPPPLQEHYPWFLPTYLSYPYNIQRVDVLRYFILLHHGGLYLDLDVGCKARLDFMRAANFTAPMTNPIGISNDIMAAAPGDAYLAYAVRKLRHWNRWMGIKYIQVGAGWGLG